MIHNLGTYNSVLNQFISEMRDINIQKDPMRFRNNMIRVGEIIAYEISKFLPYKTINVVTPLDIAESNILAEQPVLATILRAGIPFHHGFLNFFDKSSCAFVTAYRNHLQGNDFNINVEYVSSPSIQNKVLILCDPMLATGNSIILSYKKLLSHGMPKQLHIASIIASSPGIDDVAKNIDHPDFHIWAAAIDNKLDENYYIVPGLGDAGDLAFGKKE
jgi:uracil phosphoribosyltransferase